MKPHDGVQGALTSGINACHASRLHHLSILSRYQPTMTSKTEILGQGLGLATPTAARKILSCSTTALAISRLVVTGRASHPTAIYYYWNFCDCPQSQLMEEGLLNTQLN